VQRVWLGNSLEQHVPIAGNHGQKIIEIVGDPSGQTPYCFQLLRMAQLVFEMPPLGDVDAYPGHVGDLAGFVGQRKLVNFVGVQAVRVRSYFHCLQRRTSAEHFLIVPFERSGIFRRPDVVVGLAQERMLPRSLVPCRSFVVKDIPAAAILDESHAGQVPHERREALLTLPQCFEGLLVRSDIAKHGDGAATLPGCVHQWLGSDAEPDAFRLSGGPQEQLFALHPLAPKGARERQLVFRNSSLYRPFGYISHLRADVPDSFRCLIIENEMAVIAHDGNGVIDAIKKRLQDAELRCEGLARHNSG
jgi:hypothetical protein